MRREYEEKIGRERKEDEMRRKKIEDDMRREYEQKLRREQQDEMRRKKIEDDVPAAFANSPRRLAVCELSPLKRLLKNMPFGHVGPQPQTRLSFWFSAGRWRALAKGGFFSAVNHHHTRLN